MAKAQLTSAVLKELLNYDTETGVLTWKERAEHWFNASRLHGAGSYAKMWNKKFSGKPAFTHVGSHGYLEGAIFNKLQLAHRVIWCLMTGDWPEYIDHVNGDRLDNRFENLRRVTNAANGRNTKRHRRSRAEVPGVRQIANGTFQARLGRAHIGTFRTYEEAVDARLKAQKAAGYHENHWRN